MRDGLSLFLVGIAIGAILTNLLTKLIEAMQ
jgi:hypothetical protein